MRVPDEPIAIREESRYLIRTYRGGDEMALISLWNQSLPQDTIHPRSFLTKILCDPNFDPEGAILAVNSNEEAMGFLLAVVRRTPLGQVESEPESGWILTLFVHPQHRRRGLGGALLRAAEQFFHARGRLDVRFAPYESSWMWPGLDTEAYPAGRAFMEAHGFKKAYTSRMWGRRLPGFAISDEVQRLYAERAADGYQFGPLIPGYVVSLITMLTERFHPEWAELVREAIARETPFDQIIVCTDADGRLVGVASYGLEPSALARVGTLAVDEPHRGKGLGKVLLYLCLDAMRSRGLQTAWASWTFEAPALDTLLERAGFATWRSFEVLEKRLNESA